MNTESKFMQLVRYIPGFILLVCIGLLSKYVAQFIPHVDYIIVAIVIGMLIRNTVGIPEVLRPGVETFELWLKIGVVLLGARLMLQQLFSLGSIGLAMIVVEIIMSVLLVTFVAKRLKVSDKLGSLMGIGVAICGVSAIIACAPAIDADEDEQSYAIATILIFGAAALFLYPLVGYAFDMSDQAFGIWAGLAVDNTAEAVATGFIYSEKAGEFATLAKMCRNTLMGLTVLGFATYYAARGMTEQIEHKGRFLWDKFPKFIIGFIVFSLLSTVGFFTEEHIGMLKNAYSWFFMLTFAGVGLETSFKEMKKSGFRPLIVGLSAEAGVGIITLVMVLALARFF